MSIVLQDLSRFGPDRCDTVTHEEACAYTRDLVENQYENFTVVSWFLPKTLRPHFANIYAFCRWADDLGDETGDPQRSIELLKWWRSELDDCYRGQLKHPVFIALHQTIKEFDIPSKPFEDLIDAFTQDQTVTRYQTWDQVVDYCTRSADPVGRLVLYLGQYRDEVRQQLSDETCTALQLVNFWQDVRRDIIERDRIYIPSEYLSRHNLTHEMLIDHVKGTTSLTSSQLAAYQKVIHELIDRTWKKFQAGRALWPMVDKQLRLDIQLFSLGGESIMKKIEQINYNTIQVRPKISKPAKAILMLRAVFAKLTGLPLIKLNSKGGK